MSGQLFGQLYRVVLTGRYGDERTTSELITYGTSSADVGARLPWIFDLSDYATWRIDSIEKLPSRLYVLSETTSIETPADPDAVIERDDGSQGVWQKFSGQDDGQKYLVACTTVCFAKTPEAARKKLVSRLNSGSERLTFAAEEIAKDSGFAKAKDTSVFPRASFVRG